MSCTLLSLNASSLCHSEVCATLTGASNQALGKTAMTVGIVGIGALMIVRETLWLQGKICPTCHNHFG